MKRALLLAVTVICTYCLVYAQRTITGSVVDQNSEPLVGASIIVPGTSTGTVTDADGYFTLVVPAGTQILRVSYTGFESQDLEIPDDGLMTIVMATTSVALEDILVIGYAPQRRKDLTGAVSSIHSEAFQGEAGLTVEGALRGRASGVQVLQSSGTPGSPVNVRVRGSTSITATNQPLYMIDGIPLITGSFSQIDVGGQDINALADINPDDIESIEVLKDAATAAIYGSRAANGVVLITTKKGKAGPTRLHFDAGYGFQKAANLVELISAEQYREQMQTLFGSPDALAGGLGGSTDWYEEIFRTGTLQDYSLSASGGDERTRFYASGNYHDNQGIVKGTRYERYSGRLNLDHLASDKLSLAMHLGYHYTQNQRVRNDNNIFGAVSVATLLPATVPVFLEDGSYATAFGWDNPLASVTIYDNLVNTSRTTGEAYARYELIPGLFLKAKLGIDMLDLREDLFEPSILQSSAEGTAVVAQTRDIRWLTEYTIAYQKTFGGLSLYALGGAGFQEDRIEQDFARVDGFPTDDFRGLTSGAAPTTVAGSFSGDRLNSFFGHVNLTIDDKYIVSIYSRADGSSRFVNDQWGFFPGVALAWQIGNTAWMRDGFFEQLKLRAGYGLTGNNAIGNFTALQTYGGGHNYDDAPGIAPTQLGNPDLTWETTSQFNIGVDFSIPNNALGASLDFYLKKTQDLLLEVPIPTTSGFEMVPQNIGDVENRGIELMVTASPVRKKNFSWDISFNASYNKNKILKLFNHQPIDFGFATRLAEGHSIGAFFGYVTDGIFQNQEEVEAHATQPGAAPGDFRFADLSGGPGPDGVLGTSDDLPPDGMINDNDRTFIGNALPDWVGGLSNTLNFHGFTFRALLQFSLGNEIYNNNLAFAEGMHSVFNTTKRAWEGRWQQEGDDEDFPRAVLNDPNSNTRNSSRNVEDGSFLRLKTASLSYALPQSVIKKMGIAGLSLSLSGTNLITFTEYSWFDPEVNTFGEDNVALGTDFLTYPQARSVSFGIHIDF